MLNEGLVTNRNEGRIELMLDYLNFPIIKMLVSLMKQKIALAEVRGKLKIQRQPDGQFLANDADSMTIRKNMESSFSKPYVFGAER